MTCREHTRGDQDERSDSPGKMATTLMLLLFRAYSRREATSELKRLTATANQVRDKQEALGLSKNTTRLLDGVAPARDAMLAGRIPASKDLPTWLMFLLHVLKLEDRQQWSSLNGCKLRFRRWTLRCHSAKSNERKIVEH